MPLRCTCFKVKQIAFWERASGCSQQLGCPHHIHDELAFVFQVPLLSGRTIRHSVRIRPTDPATMLIASSGSSTWTMPVGTSAPSAQNHTDGNIILWSTSKLPAAKKRRNAARTVATRATASGISSRT